MVRKWKDLLGPVCAERTKVKQRSDNIASVLEEILYVGAKLGYVLHTLKHGL
jgi:hypothetical protein